MFDTWKEYLIAFFNSRLLPVAVVFVILFSVLVNRMFQLQIAETDTYANQTAKLSKKTRDIKASRGNVYDCNGKLLAYNKLSHNVVYASSDTKSDLTSEQKNEMIYKLIQILNRESSKVTVEFYIEFNKKGQAEFNISGNALLRFKAEVFGGKVATLNQEQRDMTAQEIYDFLR